MVIFGHLTWELASSSDAVSSAVHGQPVLPEGGGGRAGNFE